MILILSDSNSNEVAVDLESVTSITRQNVIHVGAKVTFFISGDKDLLIVYPSSGQVDEFYRMLSEKHLKGLERVNVPKWAWEK